MRPSFVRVLLLLLPLFAGSYYPRTNSPVVLPKSLCSSSRRHEVVMRLSPNSGSLPNRLKHLRDEIPTRNVVHSVEDGIMFVKKFATARFDETASAHISLNLRPNQVLRSVVEYPHAFGKPRRVAVFVPDEQVAEEQHLLERGAHIVGGTDLLRNISNSVIDFDVLVSTPSVMVSLSRVGRVLGPRGLMPNLKDRTVTTDLVTAVETFKGSTHPFRSAKGGIVNVAFSKVSMDEEQQKDNFAAMMKSVSKAKPPGTRGRLLKAIFLSSTMGPSVRIDVRRF
eukprot:GHVU01009089.1.p1 GENE.GHVU01009089.1~~GHVU01009089.1.p1  ORF type:complete len:281 (-),score=23.51 GHVU01009089.1:307-1149(-)